MAALCTGYLHFLQYAFCILLHFIITPNHLSDRDIYSFFSDKAYKLKHKNKRIIIASIRSTRTTYLHCLHVDASGMLSTINWQYEFCRLLNYKEEVYQINLELFKLASPLLAETIKCYCISNVIMQQFARSFTVTLILLCHFKCSLVHQTASGNWDYWLNCVACPLN